MTTETRDRSVLFVTAPEGAVDAARLAMGQLNALGFEGDVLQGDDDFKGFVKTVREEVNRRFADGRRVVMVGPGNGGLAVVSALEGFSAEPRVVAATIGTDLHFRTEPHRPIFVFEAEGRRVVGSQLIRGVIPVSPDRIVNLVGRKGLEKQSLTGAKVVFIASERSGNPIQEGINYAVFLMGQGGLETAVGLPTPQVPVHGFVGAQRSRP